MARLYMFPFHPTCLCEAAAEGSVATLYAAESIHQWVTSHPVPGLYEGEVQAMKGDPRVVESMRPILVMPFGSYACEWKLLVC